MQVVGVDLRFLALVEMFLICWCGRFLRHSLLTSTSNCICFHRGGAQLSGGIPEHCPSKNNWVSMPTKLEKEIAPCPKNNNVLCKLKAFEVWDNLCGGGFKDTTTAQAPPASDARRMISDGHENDLGPRARAVVIDGNADDDTKEKTGAIAKQENNAEI